MISSSSSRSNAFAIVAVLFLLFTTGFSRELMRSTAIADSFAPSSSLIEEGGGITREMIEDYDETGPKANTNKRSGFALPSPDTAAPAPQP